MQKCWFCNVRDAADGRDEVVRLYQGHLYDNPKPFKVIVPRCVSCAEAAPKVSKLKEIAIGVGVLLAGPSILIWWAYLSSGSYRGSFVVPLIGGRSVWIAVLIDFILPGLIIPVIAGSCIYRFGQLFVRTPQMRSVRSHEKVREKLNSGWRLLSAEEQRYYDSLRSAP